ncbi:MAG: DUF1318 domain-containing protein [Methylotenera sp.]|nr:DUF1318 domain-containing protein [Oligoflexia bacterium]
MMKFYRSTCSLALLLAVPSGGLTLGALALAALPACVTVNVNFPESAAQKATDDYVRDLYRAKERGKSAPAAGDTTFFQNFSLISNALAADEENFKLDSSKSSGIKEKLRSRIDEVITYKRMGVLGENGDGKLVLKDPSKLKTLQKQRVETLVKQENVDRDDLYQEVLKINKLPDTRMRNIEQSFARSFQAESPSGTWLQTSEGQWSQKP